jgi:hypothetical protein
MEIPVYKSIGKAERWRRFFCLGGQNALFFHKTG